MKFNLSDTIAAISTPAGEGGIAVIRISGNDSFKIAGNIFSKTKNGSDGTEISKFDSHTVHFGYISDNNEIIDEVLLTVFRDPNSYTGEDVIEISSHGGNFIAQKILSLIIKKGARHAGPGEFTKRAFLNGKMDLSQAEAVADLISSKTNASHASSIKQLEGSLSSLVNGVKDEIINVTSLLELELDFAEEDLEFVKKDEVKIKAEKIISRLEKIISSYIKGKVIREGVRLVIAGRPNSGKSSLFNYLLKTNRAIVSDIAGTTRDFIEEKLIIEGVLFNLIDTAGIRSSEDLIESEGIKRSYSKMEEADLILYLTDSSEKDEELKEDTETFKKAFDQKKSLMVYTKSDLNDLKNRKEGIHISLLKDETIEALKKKMLKKISLENLTSGKSGEIIITNLRHRICLENVVDSLKSTLATLDAGMTGEFLSVDLRKALAHLGEITGEVTNDDILNNIFRNFCIGK
ncbi:MAG: tRNA uridine-5-carboxymethylaminomethyl(34) synthesis GTPase MnmE [Bacteroidetes bacterium]|nr:tRNA uridine-5-carboxymethylaminomethyl(34) synthesis GTPase MnmE [Bacteroidota bacterium]